MNYGNSNNNTTTSELILINKFKLENWKYFYKFFPPDSTTTTTTTYLLLTHLQFYKNIIIHFTLNTLLLKIIKLKKKKLDYDNSVNLQAV